MTIKSNVDESEIAKFRKIASYWWDPQGDCRALHAINPLRLGYIHDRIPLSGKIVLDVGCGGGLLTEGMAQMGAMVTGIDMNEAALHVAEMHQSYTGKKIAYTLMTAEEMAIHSAGLFDVVTCLELLEHVPNPISVVQSVERLLKPGGHAFFSTLNRTLKSYVFAIVGAEYLLKILPKNTHDYAKFIRPSELSHWARDTGLMLQDMIGITYSPFTKEYRLTSDTSVNYIMHFIKQ